MFVISAAFLFVGAIFLYIGGSTLLEHWRYRQQGVRVEAAATGKALRRADSSTDTAYEITYQFNPSEGAPYQHTEPVSVHLWERVEQGSPLTVEYVAGAPASARVVDEDGRADMTTAFAGLGVGGVLVLLVPIGWVVLLKHDRSRRVAEGGVAQPGGSAPDSIEPTAAVVNAGIWPQRSFWPLARKSFGFWFGAFALLAGLPWLGVNGIIPLYDARRFAREGLATPGVVLTKEIRRSGSSRSENKHYEATYRFTVMGETIEGRDELSFEDWGRLVEREPAEVLYLAQEPSANRLTGRRPWLQQAFFGLLGLVFTVVGGTVFVRAVRHARLEWHLRQHGVNTQGTVTRLQDRNLKVDGVQLWRLHCEYCDFQGERHVQTFDIPLNEAQGWKVGDAGGVLYDPARPSEALWLGRAETRRLDTRGN